MTATHTATGHPQAHGLRVIAVTDSDSYVKWGAALLARMPDHWHSSLVIVRTLKLPSAGQLDAALAGSGVAASEVSIVGFGEVALAVASERPDVVVVATIGPLADIVTEVILDACDVRPVVVSGLPGIALPARRKALVYRSQADLLVLHSRREVRLFAAIAGTHGIVQDFALARLPFLDNAAALEPVGNDVVFAAQAIVPPARPQRMQVLRWLAELADNRPDLRVVIKVRALAGEAQTHEEGHSFVDLLASGEVRVPTNLVVEAGPMAVHLAGAQAVVTVSSTAALEAIAAGLPVIALDDFGVAAELINEVFIGSGLLASSDTLVAARFPHPDPAWLDDNYFHDPESDDWLARTLDLVDRNRAGTLPARPRLVRGRGGALRRAWDRKRVLGPLDTSLLGYIALAIGNPVRYLVLAGRDVGTVLRGPEVRGPAARGPAVPGPAARVLAARGPAVQERPRHDLPLKREAAPVREGHSEPPAAR